jgi:hypothetical protein
VTLAVALAAVGGVSYAASSVGSAAKAVTHIFAPAVSNRPITLKGLSSGGDQYKPGYGWGDPNHTHTGPPGLSKGGLVGQTLKAKKSGKAAVVTTSFTIDEQAKIFVSVILAKTKHKLLITQTKSKIGSGLKGRQAKTIRYLVLVPRTIALRLSIPRHLLVPGTTYQIRIIARDPSGQQKTLLIPFTA